MIKKTGTNMQGLKHKVHLLIPLDSSVKPKLSICTSSTNIRSIYKVDKLLLLLNNSICASLISVKLPYIIWLLVN